MIPLLKPSLLRDIRPPFSEKTYKNLLEALEQFKDVENKEILATVYYRSFILLLYDR